MTALTTQQRKALTSYLSTWKITPSRDIEVLDGATERFCELLLRDQPWSEMWSVSDVKDLIEEMRAELLRTANEQVLQSPVSLRKELEGSLQAKLESYPRDYFVYIELPGLNLSYLDEATLALSEQISLIKTSEPVGPLERLVRPDFPDNSDNLLANVTSIEEAYEALRPVSHFLLEQNSIYLRIKEIGALPYTLSGEESVFLSRALTSVKIIVFYGLEIGLLERREIFRTRHLDPGSRTIAHIAVHALHGHERRSEQMTRDFENFLRGITFNYLDEEKPDPSQRRNLKLDLHPIVCFLSLLRSDVHAQKIAAGIEWLIDSLVTTNQTLSLVQSCIGIEAILGDSVSGAYELGITARLSERFAYLMGVSASNRNDLRDQFRSVFAKRGDLIHARKHRLPLHDLQIVQTAQKMLQELIRKELSLMLDLPSNALSRMDPMDIKRNMESL